jgi:uncharacterized protein (TIGR02246 family)
VTNQRMRVPDTRPSPQSEVRALLESWSGAARTKDIDGLMSLYAPDIVYFDAVPPLQFTGTTEIRRNFLRWFDGWQSSIGLEIGDVNILVSGNIAIAYTLVRASGTLKDGSDVDYWVRATVCCRRSNDHWLIAHEHISVPIDIQNARR